MTGWRRRSVNEEEKGGERKCLKIQEPNYMVLSSPFLGLCLSAATSHQFFLSLPLSLHAFTVFLSLSFSLSTTPNLHITFAITAASHCFCLSVFLSSVRIYFIFSRFTSVGFLLISIFSSVSRIPLMYRVSTSSLSRSLPSPLSLFFFFSTPQPCLSCMFPLSLSALVPFSFLSEFLSSLLYHITPES